MPGSRFLRAVALAARRPRRLSMHRKLFRVLPLLLVTVVAVPALALEVPLHTAQFPEKRTIDVPFTATAAAPAGAKLSGEVRAEGPNTRIDLDFQNLHPAV